MAQWVLKVNGHVIPCGTVCLLTINEMNSSTEKRMREVFDSLIERRWGTSMIPPPKDSPLRQKEYNGMQHDNEEWEPYQDENETPREFDNIEEPMDSMGWLIEQQPAYDQLMNVEVQFQKDGGQIEMAKVLQ